MGQIKTLRTPKTPSQATTSILSARMGLVWSKTDLLGHNDVIFDPIRMPPPRSDHRVCLYQDQTVINSDAACRLTSGIIRHHYLVVWVVLGWLGSPLWSKTLKNKVQGDGLLRGVGVVVV